MDRVPKLSTPKELEAKSRELKDISDNQRGYFNADNGSNFNRTNEIISLMHGVSIIEEVIPELLGNKKNGEQVRILDVGAGAGFFTDEIRRTFGNKVKVFSTGLSKEDAQRFRDTHLDTSNSKLHNNDLKWKSIVELSDFEEFDLILDSFGEFTYMLEGVVGDDQEVFKRIEDYFRIIARKLNRGGVAYIASGENIFLDPKLEHLRRNLELIYKLRIDVPRGESMPIRIIKK